MSSKKLRKESNCLNCNKSVEGRFCSNCGQENLEPRESLWSLLTHTFEDFSHFDSKFFNTIKYLFLNPGFLTLEYNRGRRAAFVNPIRLFFFTSFLFFITLGFMGSTKPKLEKIGGLNLPMNHQDSLALDSISKGFEQGALSIKQELKQDSLIEQKSFLANYFSEKYSELNKIYKKEKKAFFVKAIEKFFHNLHYLILLLLPLFAFLYGIFYFRGKRFFSEYIIFAIHFHVIVLLVILLGIILGKLFPRFQNEYVYISIFFYQFFSMKKVFKQSNRKTILKLFLIDFIYLIFLIFFFLFVFLFSLAGVH